MNPSLFAVLGVVAAALVGLGLLLTIVECLSNPGYRQRSVFRSFLSSVWYATATLTTVGMGQFEPRSIAGAFIGLFWMVCSVVVVAGFSASIAAAAAAASVLESRSAHDELELALNGVVITSPGREVMKFRGLR